jgi:osmotically inducible lipoprotein OsmB
MKTNWNLVTTACFAMVLLGVTACGNMSTREKDTVAGAVIGGVAGEVLGGTAGAVGGAVVGGVIGNQVGKDKQ